MDSRHSAQAAANSHSHCSCQEYIPTLNGGQPVACAACSQYWQGEGCFRSNNLSTLAILRGVITRVATAQKVRVQLAFTLNSQDVTSTVELMWPKLEAQRDQERRLLLMDALQVVRCCRPAALVCAQAHCAARNDAHTRLSLAAGAENARRGLQLPGP